MTPQLPAHNVYSTHSGLVSSFNLTTGFTGGYSNLSLSGFLLLLAFLAQKFDLEALPTVNIHQVENNPYFCALL